MLQTRHMPPDVAKLYLDALTSPFNTPHEKLTVLNRLISLHTHGVKMPEILSGFSQMILEHGVLLHPDKSLKTRGCWSIIRLARHWLNLTVKEIRTQVKEIELRVKNSRL